MNLVTLTKPLLENFEDDRDDLIQQCADAEKKVHQNVKNLRKCDEATGRSGIIGQNILLVKYSTPQVRLKMNDKKPSRFQFYFSEVLEAFSMLKK